MVYDGTETYGRGVTLDPFDGMTLENLPHMEVDGCHMVACVSSTETNDEVLSGPITSRRRYQEPLDAVASKCLNCDVTDRLVFGEQDDFASMAVTGMERALAKCPRKLLAEVEAGSALHVTESVETYF